MSNITHFQLYHYIINMTAKLMLSLNNFFHTWFYVTQHSKLFSSSKTFTCFLYTYQCCNNETWLYENTGSLKKYKRERQAVFSILLKFLFSTSCMLFMLGLISFWLWATFCGFYNLFIKHNPSHYHITYLHRHILFCSIQRWGDKGKTGFQGFELFIKVCFIGLCSQSHSNQYA